MNGNELCILRRRAAGRMLAGIALSAAAISASHAQPADQASAPQPWPDVETVRTLLRADAAAALSDCRVPGLCAVGEGKGATMPPAGRAADDIRVTAIFGTARSLNVDVVVNGTLQRYRAGRADPVAGGALAAPYRLVAVDGACVRLHREGRDRTACLDAGGAHP
ncbi:hypothetical protein [Achromobacter spanius]|uniref:Uncharacterized protein n=1 Tax=Achromobacter spanius TaxID=217203 RepID=A0A2S0I5H6_9BURK|nr:hypothetical protein [Achromobacter spanius]AVJ27233.1 hypothetical protein CLM73_08985 [Achromobacter spanius]